MIADLSTPLFADVSMRNVKAGSFLLFTLLACTGLSGTETVLAQGTPEAGNAINMAATATVESAPAGNEGLPLQAGRRLRYTAEEGTWISLDVSPDGNTIVFDLLGDLYLLPIDGGKATRITNGMALDAQPRYSPDGKTLVFTSDRGGSDNIWTLDLAHKNAVPTAVTRDENTYYISPEWTPDGDYIVASRRHYVTSRYSSRDLWMIHRNGGSGKRLTLSPETSELSPEGLTYSLGAAFSQAPEHTNYFWYSQYTGPVFNTRLPRYQLYRYDLSNGKSEAITNSHGAGMRPALSNDGKYLVYASRYDHQTGLRIRELRSGDERWLAFPVQHDEQESYARLDTMPGYAFTPDSEYVVASYGGKIWKIAVNGDGQKQIPFQADVDIGIGPEVRFDYDVSDSAEFIAREIRHPALSPDGKRLVFTALNRLYVMDYPDGKATRLTDRDEGEFMPAWSPDGRWIAYTTWDEDRGGHIYKTSSNGKGQPVQLTRMHAAYRGLVWSPDGKRIVALRSSTQQFRNLANSSVAGPVTTDFVYVPHNGGKTHLIAPAEDRLNPHFIQGSERIYASGKRDGLVSFLWDGSDVKKHLAVVSHLEPYNPGPLITMNPNGKNASVLLNNQLYTVAVPARSGGSLVVDLADGSGATIPVKKLSTIAAHDPKWTTENKLTWSIGNALVQCELQSGDSINPDDLDCTPTEHRVRVAVQRDTPQADVLLTGARLVTMKGDEVIEQGDILIKNNRIVKVAQSGQIDAPQGTKIIDVTGKTITPGFVDTHYHPFSATFTLGKTGLQHRQNWQYPATLAYGVTTVRDPQPGFPDILTHADRVRSGDMVGPRIYTTGPGVFWREDIKSYQDAVNVLKRYSDYYGTNSFKMYLSGQRTQRQWLIMAARELKLMPTCEAGLNYPLNLTHAIDGYSGLEHLLHTYPVYKDVRSLFVKSGITYSPTMIIEYGVPGAEDYFHVTENAFENKKLRYFTPIDELMDETRRRGFWGHKDEYMFPRHAEFVNELVSAGGRAAVGSHGELQGLGYHWELWAMQSGGLSTHNALRVASTGGAEAIGLGRHLGSLEPGKLADLVIFDKNPLEDIRHTNTINKVMKDGRLYNGDTLNEEWPRSRKLAVPHWRNSAPNVKAGIGRQVSR